MPTYEYRCPKGHQFEVFVRKISDAQATVACPTCGAIAARVVSAGAGLVFKGSGFYITDYGKDGKKDQTREPQKAAPEPKSAEQAPGAASGAATSGGAEAAPAAPPPKPPKPPKPARGSSGDSGTGPAE